ncbi:MAG TPA: cbb3-type cytochrome oxidase assembly protein CcoS [Burkholderiaceae bacterium]|nr:cbb3-type cytochrome oxidase assembly protein CcoS [Burkholderiaceae bacterium]
MTGSLLLLLPIALVFVLLIGALFWWAIFAGQFDDTQKSGESILMDDDSPEDQEPPPGDKQR